MALINFSGLASGIDSTALIQAQSDATRKQRVTPLEKRKSELTDTNDKLTELRESLGKVKDTSIGFATLNGGGLVKSATSNDDSIFTATAANSALNGIYSVNITQKAKNAVFSFNDRFATPTTIIQGTINNGAAAANRTVAIDIGQGTTKETVSVVLTNTSTASDFVTQFNATSTKAQASLVNVGTTASPSYAIMITSNKEGLAEGAIAVNSIGSEITTAFTANTVDQATNATMTVSGITGTITRPTNSVSDVIPGLTIEIKGTGSTTVVVSDDVSSTTSKVQEFVDAFNEVVKFLAENNTITRENDGRDITNIFGPLASTRVDDNSLTSLKDVIATTSASGGTEIRIFSDLGITTERDGTLKFDTTKFAEAMSKEPSSVDKVLKGFADIASTTGGTIDQVTRFNGIIELSINSNKSQIDNFGTRIAEAEAQILKTEDQMRQRFSRLESLIGKLQGQQNSLKSALAGLG